MAGPQIDPVSGWFSLVPSPVEDWATVQKNWFAVVSLSCQKYKFEKQPCSSGTH
jgi:hypothetical protein